MRASKPPVPSFESVGLADSIGVAMMSGATGTKVASVGTRVGTGPPGIGVLVISGTLKANCVVGVESGDSKVAVAKTGCADATRVLLADVGGNTVGVALPLLATLRIGVTVTPTGTVAARVGDGPRVAVLVGNGVTVGVGVRVRVAVGVGV